MKKTLLSLICLISFAFSSNAQVGSVATDFTVTDLNGNTYNLYNILNSGKVVVLDCSATWCSTCWSFHNDHFLKDIYDTYGPNGTDEVVVIYYEADASTTLADLQGTGSNTMGDWLTGSPYPFINETPLTLSGSKYWPLGFPTINVVSPNDKKIKSDLYDLWGGGLSAMEAEIESHIPASASVNETSDMNVSVYPNPASDVANLTFNSTSAGKSTLSIYNILGELVHSEVLSTVSGTNTLQLDLSSFTSGNYFVQIQLENQVITSRFDVIK